MRRTEKQADTAGFIVNMGSLSHSIIGITNLAESVKAIKLHVSIVSNQRLPQLLGMRRREKEADSHKALSTDYTFEN
jgi:hypothetical protein